MPKKNMSYDNILFMNSNGAFDPNSAAYQIAIDTLSYIRSVVIQQKFYEIPFADFVPIDVGEGAFGSEIVQNMEFMIFMRVM